MKDFNTPPPIVSIILPVYNAGKYLKECVISILEQTFDSYELLILDDGSTDGCTDFLRNYSDCRIRLIKRKHNYISTLNYGLFIARGKYIARMDADDRMMPTRLSEQVAFLEQNSNIVLCSTQMIRLGSNELLNTVLSGTIKEFAHVLLLCNFIAHPTVMLRTNFLRLHKLKYRYSYIFAEDYKLWAEIACKGGQIHIIPKPLLEYRIHKEQTSIIYNQQQSIIADKIRNELLVFLINNKAKTHAALLRKFLNVCKLLNKEMLIDDVQIFHNYHLIFSRLFENDE